VGVTVGEELGLSLGREDGTPGHSPQVTGQVPLTFACTHLPLVLFRTHPQFLLAATSGT